MANVQRDVGECEIKTSLSYTTRRTERSHTKRRARRSYTMRKRPAGYRQRVNEKKLMQEVAHDEEHEEEDAGEMPGLDAIQ